MVSELVTHYGCEHRGFPTVQARRKKKKKKNFLHSTACVAQLTGASGVGCGEWQAVSERERERGEEGGR